MAKIINQETFDDIVKENIVEFAMSADEAKEETIKQFEAQGIDLTKIVKDLTLNETTGQPLLNGAIENIKICTIKDNYDCLFLLKSLEELENECVKSLSHRVLAAKHFAHHVLASLLTKEISKEHLNQDIVHKSLSVLISLTNKQPDIFGTKDLNIAMQIIDLTVDPMITCDILKWLQTCCIMHETNRQNLVAAGVIEKLKPLIFINNFEVLREVCALIRALVLDDDIRVEFGHGHEHGKLLANSLLIDLTNLLPEYKEKNIICDILLTIASLIVRHEYCQAVEEAGGLKFVIELLENFPQSVKLCGESLKFLRALSGHDAVKSHIVQQGAAPLIYNVFNIHKGNETFAKVALLCISTLTLRTKENSLAFFEAGTPDIIAETMKIHKNSKLIQRNAAWAIRNMVSRCQEHCESFLRCNVESLLNEAMAEHTLIQQDLKAALRDLGCKVELKEEWTGTSKIKIANK